jgi:hypothetical protein
MSRRVQQGHGLVVSVALEAVAGTSARLLFISIAMVCIIIAGPVTHGLGGALRHRIRCRVLRASRTNRPDALALLCIASGRLRHSKTGEWRFFQPWRGGVAFVACQGLGWALYSVSIVAFVAAFWCVRMRSPTHETAPHPDSFLASVWLS